MPSDIIEPFAKKSGKSKGEVEKLWNKAKKIAIETVGDNNYYAFAVGVLKNMLGINEEIHGMSYAKIAEEFINSDYSDIEKYLNMLENKNVNK